MGVLRFRTRAYVLVERDRAGEIRIIRAGQIREQIDSLTDEMIEKHAEALQVLVGHDDATE